MSRVLPAVALALAAVSFSAAPGPAHATEGPWCAVEKIGADALARNCGFFSFQQCVSEVISGNRGFCDPNPDWHGPPPRQEERHPYHRRPWQR